MAHSRQHGFDNVRCILIFLVVFGHFLEPSGTESRVYLLIYTFHMPVFVFLSGWFGRFSPQKLTKQAGLYLLFQFLYRILEYLLNGKGFSVKLLTPCWLLWYLPFLMGCQLLLPLLDRHPRFPGLAVSLLISLAAGCVRAIGYPLTLSRFLVFLPYYILGNRLRPKALLFKKAPLWVPAVLLGVAAGLSLVLTREGTTARMLYGASAYHPGYGPVLRGMLYLPGTAWSLFFLLTALRWSRRVPLLSAIGSNTLPVYLLHGFAVKLVRRFMPLPPYPRNLLPALALAAASVLIFSLFRKNCGQVLKCRSGTSLRK